MDTDATFYSTVAQVLAILMLALVFEVRLFRHVPGVVAVILPVSLASSIVLALLAIRDGGSDLHVVALIVTVGRCSGS